MGAKIIEFAGWEMPIQYTTVLDEHHAVRQRAGLFDVSHMGDILIRGDDAEGRLRRLLTNDIKDLPIGKGLYSHILNEGGRVIDDIITFHIFPGQYLMVANASKEEEVVRWLRTSSPGMEVIDLTNDLACVALQGPLAQTILQNITDFDLTSLKRMHGTLIGLNLGGLTKDQGGFLESMGPARSAGVTCYVSRSGYTGEDGFEIISSNGSAVPIWRADPRGGQGPERKACRSRGKGCAPA